MKDLRGSHSPNTSPLSMKRTKFSLSGNPYVNLVDNILLLDNVSVEDIARHIGTPSFIFLENKIIDNIRKIKEAFSTVFRKGRGFYSLKSNYLPPLLDILKEEEFGAEIVGELEWLILKNNHFEVKNVLAGGPFLSDHFLKSLLSSQVEFIVLYHIEDILRVEQMYDKLIKQKSPYSSKKIKIFLRFKAPRYAAKHGISFTRSKIEKIVSLLKKCKHVEFVGILSHLGKRLKTINHYIENLSHIISIADVFRDLNYPPSIFNLGGGFPRADEISSSHFIKILKELSSLLKEKQWDHVEIFYEPGRFIVSDSGFCLSRVFHFDKEQNTAYLDIGNNYLPKFMREDLKFYNVKKMLFTHNKPIDFMGPIPSDQDILIKNYNFTPSVERNDLVLIANVGAYSITWSTRFPYFPPNIVFVRERKYRVYFSRNLNSLRDSNIFLKD